MLAFFERLGKAADFRYINGKLSSDLSMGDYYNPALKKELRRVSEITAEFAPFVAAHKNMPYRAQTVMYRLLGRYLEYCDGIAHTLVLKCVGAGKEAKEALWAFRDRFGRYELEMETCYDHFQAFDSYGKRLLEQKDVADPD